MKTRQLVFAWIAFTLCSAAILGCEFSSPIWSITSNDADALYRFVEKGKAGYIDRSGNVVIPPSINDYGTNMLDEFHDGLLSTLREYFDMKGKRVFSQRFDLAGSFSEGLAWVQDNSKYGYIDVRGRIVITPQFKTAGDFSNGLAVIETGERSGYINKQGAFAIVPRFFRGRPFHEDRAWVIAEGPCRFQQFFDARDYIPVIDLNGIESRMPMTGSCGFGSYTLPESRENDRDLNTLCRWTLIDRFGNVQSEQGFVDVRDFSEGLAAVRVGKLWGYANREGNLVIEPKFQSALEFSDSLAPVSMIEPGGTGNTVFGYIDRTGSFAIPPQFVQATRFSEGLAVVGDNDLFWYIDRSGQQAIPAKYKQAGRFFKGLAHVQTDAGQYRNQGAFAYINPTGRKVFSYERE
jgi:hypothetical protein